MSKREITVCDRCGEEAGPPHVVATAEGENDLCTECNIKLARFLSGEQLARRRKDKTS